MSDSAITNDKRWRWLMKMGDEAILLSPEQSRAARGWLDWTQQHLADRASVSLSTVRDFEKRRRRPTAQSLAAMRQVFAEAGISLSFDADGRPSGINVTARALDGARLQ
ncbi:MAG TPA: helix-turn-helix transcriptional regulator [Arsenicitalea sp.]|nr:helix-turn-helix transcriptional regulator [Arsenicitalea sp.]